MAIIPCNAGSLGRWVAGSLGRWVAGSLGRWVAGSLGRWVAGSLGRWVAGSLGRWLAMYTCKVPRWPEEIEAECQIDPDDPYQKDWRSNGEYDFREFDWPLVCFLIGIVALGFGGYWFSRELFW